MSNDANENLKSHHRHTPGMSMTCRELFERLSEYVDGELSQEITEEIRNAGRC
jgi:hypothetical protein